MDALKLWYEIEVPPMEGHTGRSWAWIINCGQFMPDSDGSECRYSIQWWVD